MMDKARVINRVVTIVKDSQLYSFKKPTRSISLSIFCESCFPLSRNFDLNRFILRRSSIDFDQRFQRQVI